MSTAPLLYNLCGNLRFEKRFPTFSQHLRCSTDQSREQLAAELAVAEESLAEDEASALRAQIDAREKQLMPLYVQISHEFADLHDRPGRMKAKDTIQKDLSIIINFCKSITFWLKFRMFLFLLH